MDSSVTILPQHRWLERLVGTWDIEAEAAEPGGEMQRMTGHETFRSIGGIWFVGDGTSDMGSHIMTLGYAPSRSRFVGSYLSSSMPHFWLYDGYLDHDNQILSLESEGPAFSDPLRLIRYIDRMEFQDDDARILTSSYRTEAGDWEQFMVMRCRRRS